MTLSSPAPHHSSVPRVRPQLRLFTETVFVEGDFGGPDEEIQAGVLRLRFDGHDPAGERHARYVLESFGVTELEYLDTIVLAPGSEADYLVHTSSDPQRLCEFSAYVLPQLRKLGWDVEIDDAHRWKVVTDDHWFVSLEPDQDKPDWFGVKLGIEHNGQRIDLVPPLVELIEGGQSLEQLVRPGRKCLALAIGDGQFATIAVDRLRRVVAVLSEMYSGEGDGLLHRMAIAPLCELEDTDAEVEWECPKEVLAAAHALVSARPSGELAPPAKLQATLRPYQHEGFSWLQNLRANGAGGVLADDMGLGKTLQTIAHITEEISSGRATGPSLIVGPTSLVGNWQRELRKFAPHLSVVVLHGPRRHSQYEFVKHADVVITTYPVLVRDRERFADFEFYLVALDEAQTIKNSGSQAHRAACSLQAEFKLCLSGTPVENNLGELWSLFNFSMPGFLGSARRFRNEYRIPIERDGKDEKLDMLRKRCAPFILRRTKAAVAKDLPPKTELVRAVELSGPQRDLYESIRMSAHARVRKTIKKSGVASSTIAILDALMKLRQVCCDPRLVHMNSARAVANSAKYEMLLELLELQLSEGRRVLIFSQFTSMLDLIGEGLEEKGVGYLKLTGSTQNRQQKVDDFEAGRADVFLISLKAGGTGLNLTSADTVIHYDPWWNPAAQAQATDRAYRIGQSKPVFVYNLIVAGSVEEKMLHLQKRKRALADSILSAGARGLDEDDVETLFGPLGS